MFGLYSTEEEDREEVTSLIGRVACVMMCTASMSLFALNPQGHATHSRMLATRYLTCAGDTRQQSSTQESYSTETEKVPDGDGRGEEGGG